MFSGVQQSNQGRSGDVKDKKRQQSERKRKERHRQLKKIIWDKPSLSLWVFGRMKGIEGLLKNFFLKTEQKKKKERMRNDSEMVR